MAWLQQESHALLLFSQGAPLRYLPPSEVAGLPSEGPGMAISFSSAALHCTCRSVRPSLLSLPALHPTLLETRWLHLDSPEQQLLYQAITGAVALIEQGEQLRCGASLAGLELDGLLLRSIALLLLPQGLAGGEGSVPTLQQAVDQAMAWMLANLDRAISLGDLEERVRYSRRSLQLGFRQRVGCGPIQWLRRQRLKAAHDQIVSMAGRLGPTAGLAAVARRCGYSTLSGLTRDFSSLYGYSPSRLLRQSGRPAD